MTMAMLVGQEGVVLTFAQRALSASPFEIAIATSNGVVSNDTPSTGDGAISGDATQGQAGHVNAICQDATKQRNS